MCPYSLKSLNQSPVFTSFLPHKCHQSPLFTRSTFLSYVLNSKFICILHYYIYQRVVVLTTHPHLSAEVKKE